MMTAEHRGPLAGFLLVLAAASAILVNGLRTEVVDGLIEAGRSPALVTALAPDIVLGHALHGVAPVPATARKSAKVRPQVAPVPSPSRATLVTPASAIQTAPGVAGPRSTRGHHSRTHVSRHVVRAVQAADHVAAPAVVGPVSEPEHAPDPSAAPAHQVRGPRAAHGTHAAHGTRQPVSEQSSTRSPTAPPAGEQHGVHSSHQRGHGAQGNGDPGHGDRDHRSRAEKKKPA